MASIPPEYREIATCEIEASVNWGDTADLSIVVAYDRPETKEEAKEREWNSALKKKETEARERREYEALKKKFGD